MANKSSARATALPAGAVPASASLEAGKHKLTILHIGENNEMRVQYPDGWERDHQAKDVAELCPKIANNLRNRYGCASIAFLTAPALEEGAVIEVEV